MKDYYITYKKNGAYIEGFIENAFDDNKGTFKSTNDVKIEIESGSFSVNWFLSANIFHQTKRFGFRLWLRLMMLESIMGQQPKRWIYPNILLE